MRSSTASASPAPRGLVLLSLLFWAGPMGPSPDATALPAAPLAASLPPRPDHVVIVMEENHGYSEIIGSASAPYINSLAGQGILFTNYFAQYHPSEQNYLEIFSGSDQGIGTSDPNPAPGSPFTAGNWGAGLLGHGFGFKGYSEGLPSTGYSGADSGRWVYRHCPWIAFQGTGTNQIPSSDNIAFTAFPATQSSLPTVSMVTPNLDHDMHDGTIQQGDTWLQTNLDAYAQWAKTHNSLLIVVWDEDDSSQGNQVAMLMVGQGIQPGSQNSQKLDHDSLCRLICDMYGLSPMGNAATATPITGVWSAPAITGQPQNASVQTGQTATFTVTASGAGPLAYQWERSNDGGTTWTPVGTSASSYTTAATTSGDSGARFRVLVSNAGGSTPSATATLTVGAGGGVSSYRVNSGGAAAAPFAADAQFSGGLTSVVTGTVDTSAVTSPAPQAVYQSERYGDFSYAFPGLTPGAGYTVRLHFAEVFWTMPGQRVFNVAIDGQAVLSSFDIVAACGAPMKALIQEFGVTVLSSGQVDVAFTSVVDHAKISGIEILPGSPGGSPGGGGGAAGGSGSSGGGGGGGCGATGLEGILLGILTALGKRIRACRSLPRLPLKQGGGSA
ncbi:MAG TPA: alkaline phosphatase family protein [Planctomycetota bacterium]|nr:alkaline phosphatase family protein [Planctomycetota bacterium]